MRNRSLRNLGGCCESVWQESYLVLQIVKDGEEMEDEEEKARQSKLLIVFLIFNRPLHQLPIL
jgi:hypothetical protein